MRRTLFFSYWALLIGSAAEATSFVNRPLGDVLKETPNVVRATALDSYSDWDKLGQRKIFTYTNFSIIEVLKGNIKDSKILVRQPGGAKDGMEMNVPGAASFQRGEEVVLLLGLFNNEDTSYDIPGFTTGKYNIQKDESGLISVVNSLGGGSVHLYGRGADSGHHHDASYNSSFPYLIFKKIVQGQDLPEAGHQQFVAQKKPDTPKNSPVVVNQPMAKPVNEISSMLPVEDKSAATHSAAIIISVLLLVLGLAVFLKSIFKKRGPS